MVFDFSGETSDGSPVPMAVPMAHGPWPGLEDQVIEVQLDRVPGRRIPLGLEWQDAAKHNCKAEGGMANDGK